ncbi:MAG: hypothetical protein ACH6QK_00390 [Candidatus Carsonella ruddii]
MNYILNNEKIIFKNNFLFIKNVFFCKIKIPLDIKLIIIKNKISFYSYSFNKKNEISFLKLIINLIKGIEKKWIKEVFFLGIGFKIFKKNNKIFFDLGFSFTKCLKIPKYLDIEIFKNKIILNSVYKDKMGIFIKKILNIKKFNPYKKKGIFLNNPILKKSSKKKQ